MQLSTWKVMNLVHVESLLREAKLRIHNLERRSKRDVDTGMMVVFVSMLYGKLPTDLMAYVYSREKMIHDPKFPDDPSKQIKVTGRDDFEWMRESVEVKRKMERNNKAIPMEISYLADIEATHADYVAWNDAGAPEDLYSEEPEYEAGGGDARGQFVDYVGRRRL